MSIAMEPTDFTGALRLYACGGFGINIVSQFEPAVGNLEPGHALAWPVYIDTSGSNFKAGISADRIYRLDDVDGAGKIRKEHHVEITRNIRSILQDHAPMDLNVVVFSASGGSGSVFGPLIIAELLSRGLPVLAVVVGSDESAITAQNTLSTLKSLEAIAAKTGQPVVICYEHNSPDIKRSVIDEACHHTIGALSILASRRNLELDTRDLTNWIQFNRTTSIKEARLALFDVYDSNEAVKDSTQPISVASLYDSPDADPLPFTPEYHCAGYPREKPKGFKVTHFVIQVHGVPVIVKMVQGRLDQLTQQSQARVVHASLVGAGDKVEDNGLVF